MILYPPIYLILFQKNVEQLHPFMFDIRICRRILSDQHSPSIVILRAIHYHAQLIDMSHQYTRSTHMQQFSKTNFHSLTLGGKSGYVWNIWISSAFDTFHSIWRAPLVMVDFERRVKIPRVLEWSAEVKNHDGEAY